MTIGYTDCPYCEVETEVNYEDQNEGDSFEQECEECNKTFAVCYQTDVSFTTTKLAFLADDALEQNKVTEENLC